MLKSHSDELNQACERYGITPGEAGRSIEPLNASTWIAMSILQKAIRRGQSDLALRAACRLAEDAPKRLWRRLCLTAIADVGVGSVPLLAPMIATMTNQTRRRLTEDDWIVAKKLVLIFAHAPKCRFVDDLLMIGLFRPRFEELRTALSSGGVQSWSDAFLGSNDFETKAVILLAFHNHVKELGIPKTASDFQLAFNVTKVIFQLIRRLGAPTSLVDACHTTYTMTREPLALLFPLVFTARATVMSPVDDPFPEELYFDDIPLWSVDKFTRPGAAAIGKFLKTGCATAKWVREACPAPVQTDILARLVFAVEGGQMRRRLSWPLADDYREIARRECLGNHCPDASQALTLMPSDIAVLNELRAQCLE